MGIWYRIEYQFLFLAPSLWYTETMVISIFDFLPRYFWLIIDGTKGGQPIHHIHRIGTLDSWNWNNLTSPFSYQAK